MKNPWHSVYLQNKLFVFPNPACSDKFNFGIHALSELTKLTNYFILPTHWDNDIVTMSAIFMDKPEKVMRKL